MERKIPSRVSSGSLRAEAARTLYEVRGDVPRQLGEGRKLQTQDPPPTPLVAVRQDLHALLADRLLGVR